MLVRLTVFLLITCSLLSQGAEPLTRKALIQIANTDQPADQPSIPELNHVPLVKHWVQRTIWEYYDGDKEKEKCRGTEYWSADGTYHISRVTHEDGIPKLEDEQVLNLTTYDAEKKRYRSYLVDEEDVLVAEGTYDAKRKSMTFEGKSKTDDTAVMFTIRFKADLKAEMDIDLYYDGERMATGRSRVGPIKEQTP